MTSKILGPCYFLTNQNQFNSKHSSHRKADTTAIRPAVPPSQIIILKQYPNLNVFNCPNSLTTSEITLIPNQTNNRNRQNGHSIHLLQERRPRLRLVRPQERAMERELTPTVRNKPNAPAVKSQLFTAPARNPPPKIPLLVLVVHAVCSPPSLPRHQLTQTGARPAGACTCDRAGSENTTPSGSTCACGSRPAGMLSCSGRGRGEC